ncbi:PREDICTED: homeobox-DDT domain protein RLT2 isoform X2 [Theobroma cacao]|uniref:Homeobox-DDT domain protein RLT2 isoform X2 n=1 Tax=Theobroma cacao TaxID=3641 RepID=A0AB32VUS7_THECC|nr:PREDICTED: homeobox-DDT domain protein RLT2 isoform X2 [Theobroma cacao]
MESGGVSGGGGSSEGEKKKPPEGETKVKRKMKTASQLEILEKTYAMEMYPSEATRAELSVQLGLSDRQLQMWFCHRRLKDRKAPPVKRRRKDSSLPAQVVGVAGEEMGGGEAVNEHGSDVSSLFGPGLHLRRAVPIPGMAVPRYYEMTHSMAELELRAITFVELQLGEPIRDDGPMLGMEFDPLPPGAFGAPIGASTAVQQKQPGQPFETKIYERLDTKAVKGSVRAVHEYQFLPEQPSVRTETYERVALSYHYGSPTDDPHARASSLSTGCSFVHGNEKVPSGYGFSGQMPNLNLLPQQSRQGHLLPTASGEYDNCSRKNSLTNTTVDAIIGAHPISALESPFVSSDRRVNLDEDALRMERKRKSEEARIAREVEAHEKRIRKELEKQDILRRKREEQIRKEMERHDRERRKEEERLLREKQREEERYQREQRRELERREKFLMKESIRAERMRQKEELRKEKEAARLKAANERAIARKLAKESMELIEDERLELMELAASSKGLSSTLSLDFEILQNLDIFRDKLCVFPPKGVQLKRPFSIEPWNSSEESIGNILMVWRFLITFADVVGLWPFTLDELVQAFHDYDPRLLGEIHVALLRSIIKDIEDVARTPSTGLGASQNNAANPGGGHLQIVEGAYAWGFDIRSWQGHLNMLTWPEILRQFALSAGFGPQLKKRNIEQAYLRDENEGNDGEDIITNLRNGAAAENAVAIMQERGFSNPRRSRHRLTPGTVKFAAFHVLSLEDSDGLTILEVAEKIQKSGLRDLTTSKTPEASIAAALSRDTKLFERTAPSTYCVRSPYRKDPADAEAILSAARERIRVLKSGFVGEDAEGAERDEDSESDIAEDLEVDDLGAEINPKKEMLNSEGSSSCDAKTILGNEKEICEILETPQGEVRNVCKALSSPTAGGLDEVKYIDAPVEQSMDAAGICNGAANAGLEDTEIDESKLGEPWVQGLMEGDYSDLSVEERLNALIALISIAIEGNSIRVVLEERLEAANALKKQMWAEAQLDKRRMKEEFVLRTNFSSHMGNKMEPSLMMSSAECRQSPQIISDRKNNESSVDLVVQQECLNNPQNDQNYLNNVPSEGNMPIQDFSIGPDNLQYPQPGCAAERSRSQLKSYIGHKAEEMYVYRSLPLGQDRRHNRYWRFITSTSWNDPGCGRIFVELLDGRWRLIDTEEGFDTLLSSLDVRGVRESHLHAMLQKIEMSFKEAVRRNKLHVNMERQNGDTIKKEANEMASGPDWNVSFESPSSTVSGSDSDMSETSTSFSIELCRNEIEKNDALKRYRDFEKWMWKECFSLSSFCATKYGRRRCKQLLGVCDSCFNIYFFEDNHCPSCHRTDIASRSMLNFSEHVAQCAKKLQLGPGFALDGLVISPLRIRLTKLQLALVEVSIPFEALQSAWTEGYRNFWGMKLYSSTTAEELLQVLTLLESSITRDYLSSNFETTRELLSPSILSGGVGDDSTNLETVPVLPWIPKTTAAVALRLIEFDAAISYTLKQRAETHKGAGECMFPSKDAVVKNNQDHERMQTTNRVEYLQEASWVDVGIGFSGSGRGRGRGRGRGVTRGGRSQRRPTGSRSEFGKRITTTDNEGLVPVLGWKSRSRGRGGRKRGRRSARSRPKPAKRMVEIAGERENPKEIMEKSSRNLETNTWNGDEVTRLKVRTADNASSSERSEYNDENGQATGDEYDYLAGEDYAGGFNGKADDVMEGSEYNIDGDEGDEDDDGEERDDIAEGEQGNFIVGGYINENSDEEEIRNGDDPEDSDPYVKQYGYSTEASSDFSE